MINKKKIGSFYTPKAISDFLVDYLCRKLSDLDNISILEPSAGDGVFVRSLFNHEIFSRKIREVTAVEQSKIELDKISGTRKWSSLTAIHSDFLEFQNENEKKFSLVIGNPPYIKKNLLEPSQIDHCKIIHQNAKLSDNQPKNIWAAFLVRCIEFTAEDGILAFVLPSELLQVKFASELREFILKEFARVEVFTFNELLFDDCKGQDTLILIGERKSDHPGLYYCNIEKVADLAERKFSLVQNAEVKESKWTRHHLDSDEIQLLERLKAELKNVNCYSSSKAGIVTAANDYFIVDANTVKDYSLQSYIKPIIQKSIFVNGGVEFTTADFDLLVSKPRPAYLIAISKESEIAQDTKFAEYIEIGKDRFLHERYKMTLREKWFEVPNIGLPPTAFFFKRCNEYPKFIKNTAQVLATDSAYLVTMKPGFTIESLIYSFYNSLTLAFSELDGRYYGGGVLELTPNEFKQLPVPYLNLENGGFEKFVQTFKGKRSIGEICKTNDAIILKSTFKDLTDSDLEKLSTIRTKLYKRRRKLS